jgi:hypothetical protein
MARAIQQAEMSEHVDLDQDTAFIQSYIAAMSLAPN